MVEPRCEPVFANGAARDAPDERDKLGGACVLSVTL